MSIEINQKSLNSTRIEDVLSEWHQEILSPDAQRMFLAIWFGMARNASTECWFSDEQASIKARVVLQRIPAARAELVNAGLVTVRRGQLQWLYGYIEQQHDVDDRVEPIYASDLEEAAQ
jgi:hypothetical protein